MKKENYGRKIYKHIVSGVIDYSPTSLLGRQGFPVRASEGDPLLTFNMTRAGGDIVGNTLVYLFDGQGSDAGKFNHKVQEVTLRPGSTFDDCCCRDVEYSLVTANTDFSGGLIQPVRSAARKDLKMWETQLSVGGTLPSMPELRTASIDGQQVIGGQDNSVTGTTILSRNVALVKVVIADAGVGCERDS